MTQFDIRSMGDEFLTCQIWIRYFTYALSFLSFKSNQTLFQTYIHTNMSYMMIYAYLEKEDKEVK